MFSLRYCKDIANFGILSTLGMPGYAHLTRYYQPEEKFSVYLQAKNRHHSPCFSGDIANICKLLILGNLANPNDSINLKKTLMFTCMPKIHFIIHFFLEILHFEESCNLIGQQHFGL